MYKKLFVVVDKKHIWSQKKNCIKLQVTNLLSLSTKHAEIYIFGKLKCGNLHSWKVFYFMYMVYKCYSFFINYLWYPSEVWFFLIWISRSTMLYSTIYVRLKLFGILQNYKFVTSYFDFSYSVTVKCCSYSFLWTIL